LTINPAPSRTGLFGSTIAGSLIRDIGLTNVDITSTTLYIGSLAGVNAADINNVYATGNIKGSTGVGGLVGSNEGVSTISSSFTDMTVISTSAASGTAGGLVGRAFGSNLDILNSHSLGTISGGNQVGGLVGQASSVRDIYNSYATGYITGLGDVGGLVGKYWNYGTIADSFATGNINGSGGGLIGTDVGTLTMYNVYATGNVKSGGGLIGSASGINLSNAFATGDVGPAGGNVGGLIGVVSGSLDANNVYATGNVISSGDNAGGLIGYMYGGGQTIKNSYATGNVTGGGDRAGGLVGYMTSGAISNSWASGEVNANGSAGGLVGWLQGAGASITASHATGNVTGEIAGGLVGVTGNGTVVTIADSWADGIVTGTYAGGLIGILGVDSERYQIFANNYYNGESNSLGVGGYRVLGTSYAPIAEGGVAGVQSLTAEQLGDAEITSTITQGGDPQTVLTARAEAAAAQVAAEAAAEAAAQAARQDLIATVASIADDQQASIAQLAATAGQALGPWEPTPIDLSHAIRDFTPSQTNRSDKSYSASVKEVTVDGVTYLVDDEEKEN
jgi:hypothetical protein